VVIGEGIDPERGVRSNFLEGCYKSRGNTGSKSLERVMGEGSYRSLVRHPLRYEGKGGRRLNPIGLFSKKSNLGGPNTKKLPPCLTRKPYVVGGVGEEKRAK